MTTKNSPLSALKKQADLVASMLKKAERGEPVGGGFEEKIKAARERGSFKFAVVMDDKTLLIVMTLEKIRSTSEAGISEYIVGQMRENPDPLH